MARHNYLISGLSGTGKSSVCIELIARGYSAVDADDSFAYLEKPKTLSNDGTYIPESWNWDAEKLLPMLDSTTEEILFVCGGASNEELFKNRFEKSIKLVADDTTMEHRLLNREVNNYKDRLDEVAQQLFWNRTAKEYAVNQQYEFVDATQPLKDVTDEVLRLCIKI